VRLSPLGTSVTNWPIVPAPDGGDDDDECGTIGGIRIARRNRSNQGKPAPAPLCLLQIPRDLGSNSGHRGGKPATNRLSYGTTRRLR
jgi:hypothetical protein